MKKCFLFVLGRNIFGVPIAESTGGFDLLYGPAVFFGAVEETAIKDIGMLTLKTINSHRVGIPDKDVDPTVLIRSFEKFGIKSYSALFRKCLQMSIEEVSCEKYELTPYRRLKPGEGVGAEPIDVALCSGSDPDELGNSVINCISYCE